MIKAARFAALRCWGAVVSALAVLLCLSCASPQPKAPPEPIEDAYSRQGPFVVRFQSARWEGVPYLLALPEGASGELPGLGSAAVPGLVWCNGSYETCERYRSLMARLASWGFAVIGDYDSQAGTGEGAFAAYRALVSLGSDSSQPLGLSVDPAKVGIMGHSQGAGGAVNAATRFSSACPFRAVATLSLPALEVCDPEDRYSLASLSAPILMLAGDGFLDGAIISPLSAMKANLTSLSSAAYAAMARRAGTDHNECQSPSGGALCGYLVAWFRAWLMDDASAQGAFLGPDAELARNPLWRDVARRP
jgi:hypothetical protein